MTKSMPTRVVFRVLWLTVAVLARSTLAAEDDPKNIAGYDKTAWGMTEDEVLKAEAPRAEKLDKPEILVDTNGRPTGDFRSIVIKEIKVGSEKANFRAIFIFDKNQKLKQVNLESVNDINPAETMRYVEKLLTEKYGAPTYKQEGKNASWKLPKTSIEIRYFNLPILKAAVVIYRPAAFSADASKNL